MFNRLMFLFSLVAVIVIGIVNLLVGLFSKASGNKQGKRKERYYAAMISFGPIMLLLVQSFGSLNIITGAGVVFFVALGCFVIKKRV